MSRFSSYGPLDDRLTDDLDIGFIGFNNRLRPDQLARGVLADSQNGRLDINGEWQVRKGIDLISAPLAVDAESLTIPFYVYSDRTSSALARASDVITITTTANPHGIVDGSLVNVTGITGITPDPNGNRVATYIDATNISITVTGLSGTIAGTATVSAPILADSLISGVYGSCKFTDPNNDSDAYIILATNVKAVAVKVSDQTTTDIDYPGSTTISTTVDVVQLFNKVVIFRDGEIPLEWDADLTGSPAFTEVANGDYTQPVLITATNNTVVSDGEITVTATSHNLTVGTVIRIIDGSSSVLDSDDEYAVATVPGANSFTFYANVDNQVAHTVVYMERQSIGLGFTHMPSPPWGIYHQTRVFCPFKWTTTGTLGSPTIATRNIVDEGILSDALDYDTFDQIQNKFRFNAGSADYLVGAHSFSDDKLVVFNRNSIHLIIDSVDLDTAKVDILTNEVGLVARKTLVQVGENILFLSDNGIYGANFIDLYNLRGNEVPLSESINSTISRVNKAYWENSVAVYYDNRYFIALPIDGSMVNNAILVYNFLNKQWESIDTVNNSNWEITNMLVAGSGADRGVYVVNQLGGIHKLDERTDDKDRIVPTISGSEISVGIQGDMLTRMFTLNSIARKKWNSFEIHAESTDTNTSDFTITGVTQDEDASITIGTLSSFYEAVLPISEDTSIRGRIGNYRAYGFQMQINGTQGRPKIKAIKVGGSETYRSLNKAD